MEIADRFQLAQSWWLASELARRHPDLLILETHPGGGQYDTLTIARPSGAVLDINRGGGHIHIHVPGTDVQPIPLTDALTEEDPHALVRQLEQAARLPVPAHAASASPRSLTYRTLAFVLNATVNQQKTLDVRSEYEDTSGYGAGPRGWLAGFPLAAQRVRERRPDDLYDIPEYRYWLILRDDTPVAALDTDGFVYIGEDVRSLPAAYHRNGRSLARTTLEVVGSLFS